MGGNLLRFYENKGIQQEQGPGYSPEVNGLAERHQLTMQDVALPSLADSADERHGLKPLSGRFAGYALVYANDLHNAIPASGALVGRTPYEGLLGRQVTLGVFRRFGCRCWVHTLGKPFVHRHKFEPRARPGRFLGFDQPFGSGIYKVLLDSGEVTQSQTVVFDDAPHVPHVPLPVLLPAGATQQQSRAGEQALNMTDCESDCEEEVEAHPLVPPVSPVAPSTRGSDSDSADGVEIHRDAPVMAMPEVAPAAQAARQHLIGNEQSEQAANHQPETLPLSDHQPMAPATGRPVRTSRVATPHYASAAMRNPMQGGEGKRKRDRKGNQKRAVAPFKAAVNTPGPHSRALPPRTVAEALSRPDADRWRAAIDEELASCRELKVWEEVHLPKGKQALPSFFIFETKRDGRYKARLVAGGHRQRQGLDFEETYASVGSYRTMRMMMAIAAHEDLELRQFDVRTAFLNGCLKEEVYLQVPAGLEGQLGTAGKVLRLRRAIYRLRQASRAWNERLQGELARRRFAQSNADSFPVDRER
jgi:hypothetical protein